MNKKITMYQGSSIDEEMIQKVHEFAKKGKKILIILDFPNPFFSGGLDNPEKTGIFVSYEKENHNPS